MTVFIMFFIMIGYVGLVIFCTQKIISQTERRTERKVSQTRQTFEGLLKKKETFHSEKMDLENEAMEMFTLYEITKEITKSTNEEDAFEIFRRKLAEHVDFHKCDFLAPDSSEVKKMQGSQDYFVFTLQGKKSKIAYLVIEGILEEDQEKVMILAHQFALALRRVKLYEEIEKIAITDSLTEVHTRRYALERFEEEIRRSKMHKIKLSFLMIDVDYFKNFNDNFGHLAGDQILREIGYIIKESIREIDIAGRYGGEEFCIILPDTDRDGAHYAAERIRQTTERDTIRAYDTTVKATVSIGIATYPDDGKSLSELIDKADWALYRAKKQGRNRVCAFGVYEE